MRPRIAAFVFISVIAAARGADATSPVNPAQRNEPFSPGPGAAPERQAPAGSVNTRVQDSRVAPPVVERKESPLGERRAPVATGETREKEMIGKAVRPTETLPRPMSAFDHQSSTHSTKEETVRPPKVARYQESLDAASASNMARFPALGGATTAKINRFVFRKNAPDPDRALSDAPATPAAGGAAPAR